MLMLCRAIVCLAPILLCTASACAQPIRAEDQPDRIVLANERLTLAIGKDQKGGVISITDNATGRELAAPGPQRILLLALSDPAGDGKQRVYVNSHEAQSADYRVESGEASSKATVLLHNLGGRGIECTYSATVRAGDPLVRWRLEQVAIPDGLVLEEAQFPTLVLRTPEPAAANDAVVIGHTKGGVFHKPSAWEVNKQIYGVQPGTLAAQFGCYYDDQIGVYSAAYDPQGYPKNLWVVRRAEGLEVTWRHPCYALSSFSIDYDIVTGTFSGADPDTPTDWRDAADIYKAWAQQQHWCAKTYAQRDDIPQWLKDGPGMVRFSRNWLATPQTAEHWLRDYWLKRFPEKTPLIVAYWGWEKIAGWVTPDYFPLFPSDEQFTKLAGMNREIGGHVFPWPSGYHYTTCYGAKEDGSYEWDDRERFDTQIQPHAVHNRDGATYRSKPSWLRGGENSCMCPGDPWTLDWFTDISARLADRGADMIQVDQVVGGRFPPCYSKDHGHPVGPGLWMTEVFRRQLTQTLARLRETDPQSVICFEEPNEHFIQQIAVQDYRDVEIRSNPLAPELASVFGYVYHEYLPVFQSNPGGLSRALQAYCLVNGQIPHMTPWEDLGPGPLLSNGGFEKWNGDRVDGWDQVGGWQGEVWRGTFSREQSDVHAGAACLRLTNVAETDVVQVSRNLPFRGQFRAGGVYRISAWMKAEKMAKPNSIGLGALTSDLKSKGGWRIEIPAEGTRWTRGEATFTAPAGADFLRIMLHIEGPASVLIDDVVLEEIGADGSAAEVIRPELPPDHEFMLRWVELFHGEGRPYLLLGRMLHPGKLQCASTDDGRPAILHNAYRAPDGTEAVVMANTTDERQEAQLQWKGQTIEVSLEPWEVALKKLP